MPITKYVWDPVNDSYLMETDVSDVTTAVYTNEPDRFGGIISQRRGSTTSTFHYDGLGSTRELTDNTETVTDTYVYSAFGETVAKTGTTTNPFRWVGEKGYYFDEETDDYYVRARVFQPSIGRWISFDPIFFVDGLNLYKYVHNAPVKSTDPSGLAKRNVCIFTEKRTCNKWKIVSVGATKARGFSDLVGRPPGVDQAEEYQVTEIVCNATGECCRTYQCHPCCWSPGPPPKNKRIKICKTIMANSVYESLDESDLIFVTRETLPVPLPLPDFIPGPEIVLGMTFVDDGSENLALRKCEKLLRNKKLWSPHDPKGRLLPGTFDCKVGAPTPTPE